MSLRTPVLLDATALFASRNYGNRKLGPVATCKTVAPHEQNEVAENFIRDKSEHLRVASTRHRGSIGQAKWLVDQRLSLVIKSKGSFGFVENGVRYLSAYETLAVIECHEYEVLLYELPLSMEEAYALCLTDDKDLDVYRVYSKLVAQGLRVWKAKDAARVMGDTAVRQKGDTRKSKREASDSASYDLSSAVKRRRIDSSVSSSPGHQIPIVQISQLLMSDVRHREFVVPPIHEHLKSNAKNWKDFKEIDCEFNQKFIGRVADLSHGVTERSDQQLPSFSLNSDASKCVNRFDEILTLPELSSKLQSFGPRELITDPSKPSDLPSCLQFRGIDGEEGTVLIFNLCEGLPSPQLVQHMSEKHC